MASDKMRHNVTSFFVTRHVFILQCNACGNAKTRSSIRWENISACF